MRNKDLSTKGRDGRENKSVKSNLKRVKISINMGELQEPANLSTLKLQLNKIQKHNSCQLQKFTCSRSIDFKQYKDKVK